MDADELIRRDGEISKGLQRLLDDMYAAIDEKAAVEMRSDLIQKGEAKVALFDKLLAELQGVQREQFERKYKSFVAELKGFLPQLKESP
jgi:hypothetical protein